LIDSRRHGLMLGLVGPPESLISYSEESVQDMLSDVTVRGRGTLSQVPPSLGDQFRRSDVHMLFLFVPQQSVDPNEKQRIP
jgi:hypothetical protein